MHHFRFPAATYAWSRSSTSSSAPGVVTIYCSHSDRVWRDVLVPFACINSMADGSEHPSMHLPAICVSPLGKCLFVSLAHVLIGFYAFYCWVSGHFYTFWMSVFGQQVICEDFLPLCTLSFHPLNRSFTEEKALILVKFNVTIFLSLDCVFAIESKKSLPISWIIFS